MTSTTPPPADREDDTVAIDFVRLRPAARVPARQTPEATGYDLHACIDAPIEVGELPVRVPCGIAFAAPPGAEAAVAAGRAGPPPATGPRWWPG